MPNGPREKRKDSVEIPKRVKYNEKLANEIVELIRTGKSEAKICKLPGMPHPSTLCEWKHKHPEFLVATIEARRFSAELFNDLRIGLASELAKKAQDHERTGVGFPRGTVEAYRAAMQEFAREAAIRDDSRFSDRQKVIAEVEGESAGEGMDVVYAKMREVVEAQKNAGK